MQEIDNPLLMHEVNRPFNAFKGILEHTRSDNKTKQSIFKVKESDYKINLVSDDEMELFLSRLDKRRDIPFIQDALSYRGKNTRGFRP